MGFVIRASFALFLSCGVWLPVGHGRTMKASNHTKYHIVLIGGRWERAEPLPVEIYDTRHFGETMKSKPDSPSVKVNRYKFAIGLLSRKIYIAGGKTVSLGNNLNSTEIYDLGSKSNGRWKQGPSMNDYRVNPAFATLGDRLYVCGGDHYKGFPRFDEPLASCEYVSDGDESYTVIASMGIGREGAAAVALNGFLYVTGGHGPQSFLQDSVERYDPGKNEWKKVARMNEMRKSHAAAVLEGMIYVCGGSGYYSILNDCEIYNPISNRWSVAPLMWKRRYGFGLIPVNGELFALGGRDVRTRRGAKMIHRRGVEKYNPRRKVWRITRKLRVPRSEYGALVF